jgi:hypothetical protein
MFSQKMVSEIEKKIIELDKKRLGFSENMQLVCRSSFLKKIRPITSYDITLFPNPNPTPNDIEKEYKPKRRFLRNRNV